MLNTGVSILLFVEVVLEEEPIGGFSGMRFCFNPTFRGSRSGRWHFYQIFLPAHHVSILLFVEVVLEAFFLSLGIFDTFLFQSYFSWKSFWKPELVYYGSCGADVSILLFVEVVLEDSLLHNNKLGIGRFNPTFRGSRSGRTLPTIGPLFGS